METLVQDTVESTQTMRNGHPESSDVGTEKKQRIALAAEQVRSAYEAWLAATEGMTPEERAQCFQTLLMVNATGKQIQRSVQEICGIKTQHRQL